MELPGAWSSLRPIPQGAGKFLVKYGKMRAQSKWIEIDEMNVPSLARSKTGDYFAVSDDSEITQSIVFIRWTSIEWNGTVSLNARSWIDSTRNDLNGQSVTVHETNVVPGLVIRVLIGPEELDFCVGWWLTTSGWARSCRITEYTVSTGSVASRLGPI